MNLRGAGFYATLHTFSNIRVENSASKKVNRKNQIGVGTQEASTAVHLASKQQKGGPAMQTSPPSASTQVPQTSPEAANTYRKEDLVYQVVTVAAILLVLCTLWLF